MFRVATPLRRVPDVLPSHPPTIFSFTNRTNTTLFGCYFLPPAYDPTRKHKTLVKVYGGPHVQTVYNSYDLTGLLDLQMYAALGFIVVLIDNRGSDKRGLRFESELYRAMGTVEIDDQVAGIEYLVSQGVGIDTARIGITGWSYGGYLSLMALGQRPDVFRIAIPKCPVTLWEAYDTGYTERYMGTPKEEPEAYKNGSIMTYIKNFPNEDGRLLLVHGMQDENVHFANTLVLIEGLIAGLKPYQLLVFPRERHGCANPTSRLYLETSCAWFLIDNMR
jgi:dipeptidyl aminopeptidase/acylaminoacyl peptidase